MRGLRFEDTAAEDDLAHTEQESPRLATILRHSNTDKGPSLNVMRIGKLGKTAPVNLPQPTYFFRTLSREKAPFP